MDDWSSKSRPDLFHFVPYTWRFSLMLKDFEFCLMANEYNWIDCSGQTPENGKRNALTGQRSKGDFYFEI